MKATQLLSNLGQSIWLDNITRDLLDNGTLRYYIHELGVTGLTSNPTSFEKAIQNNSACDGAIDAGLSSGKSSEETFFDLALEDITRAGTREALPAMEEALFAGIPVNVTLLFSPEQYLAAADAFVRGIERRLEAGLNPNVGSVASVFVSRWDAAVRNQIPTRLHSQLWVAIAKQTYKTARRLPTSPNWQRLYNAGARPQRLLWASTGTKDPSASDILYVRELAAPFTVNAMTEGTLKALAKSVLSAPSWLPTAAIVLTSWDSSPEQASTSPRSLVVCKKKEPHRPPNPGTN